MHSSNRCPSMHSCRLGIVNAKASRWKNCVFSDSRSSLDRFPNADGMRPRTMCETRISGVFIVSPAKTVNDEYQKMIQTHQQANCKNCIRTNIYKSNLFFFSSIYNVFCCSMALFGKDIVVEFFYNCIKWNH